MTARSDLNRTVSDWLVEQAGQSVPDYLDEVLTRTSRTRQRPAWSSLERWLPVNLSFSGHRRPVARLALLVVLLAAILLIAVAFIAGGAGQRRLPHFGSMANGQIAFLDGTALKIANADGSNSHVAASLPSGVQSLTFSPDGQRLAYRTAGPPATIVVANADGSSAMVVTAGHPVAESEQVGVSGPFAWSPDSARLAFTWLSELNRRSIAIVDADGSHLTQLTQDSDAAPYDRFDPAWSPDGQWIAFFADRSGVGDMPINLVHPDGTDEHLVATSPVDLANVEMTWSPDPATSRLAFVSGGDQTGGAITVLDLATGNESAAGSGLWISWSPDAKRLAWWGNGGVQTALLTDVLAAAPRAESPFANVSGITCVGHPDLAGKAICGPAQWSPDSTTVFGPDITGTSLLFSRLDGSAPPRLLLLDHPIDLSAGPSGQVAWQAIAP